MSELPQGEWVQSKWPRSMWRRDGAAVASSGLKHGAPRDLAEGRAKLSIQSRERATSLANFISCVYQNIHFFIYWCMCSDCCAAAAASAGRLRRAIGAQGGCFAP